MYITTLEHQPLMILELDGRLDAEGSVQLEQALQNYYDPPSYPAIVLNLGGVDYINSSGLRVLARFFKLSQEANCPLRLYNLSDNVERAMEMVGLRDYFPRYASLEEALTG